MENFIRIVSTLFVGTLIKFAIDYFKNKDNSVYKKGQPLRGPKAGFYVGFFGGILFFGIFAVVLYNDKSAFDNIVDIIGYSLFFATFFVIYAYLCLTAIVYKVEYDDEKFVKTSCFKKKYTVYYNEITKLAYSNFTFYVYTESKRYKITPASIGFKDFLARVQAKTGLLVQTK